MRNFLTKFTKEQTVYLVLIGFTISLSILYQILNTAPQKWDSAAHINLSMLYANKFKELRIAEIPTLSGYYPPFVHLAGSLIYLLIPILNSPLILTFLFLIFGLVYLFKLTHLLTQDKTIALFSCLVFALTPQVFTETRLFQLDLPLTALIIASLYYLFKSNGFVSKKHIILFFLLASFAQLTKWYAFLYLLIPFFGQTVIMFKTETKQYALVNVLKGLILSVFLVVPWYAINQSSIFNFFSSVASLGELNDPQNVFSLTGVLEYFYLSFAFQTSFPFFVLILASIVVTIAKKIPYAKTLAFSVLFPWLCFTLLKNKDVRYIMPVLPFFMASLTLFLMSLKGSLISKILKPVLITYLGILFLFISFNQIPQLPRNLRFIGYAYAFPTNKYQWLNGATNELSFKAQDWQISNMFNYLVNDLDKYKTKTGKIMFVVDYPYFNSINFDSLQINKGTYYKTTAGYDIYYLDLGNGSEGMRRALYPYDYVVTAYNPGDMNLRHYDKMVQINRFMQQQGDTYFESKASYRLPNGEEVYLFRNKKPNLFGN